MFSCALPALAAENEAPHERYCDCEAEYRCGDCGTECRCDDCEEECRCDDCGEECRCDDYKAECLCDDCETPHIDSDESTEPAQAEAGYFLLETISGMSVIVFGTPDELTAPEPRLVGNRPCIFKDCPNTVKTTSKNSYVCDNHKCSVSGCSIATFKRNPNKCQYHAGINPVKCQAYVPGNPNDRCDKTAVSGSLACWDHHCPGCLGPGRHNATICRYCRQCWVPGCPNDSTCTNECDNHCPHKCKTHHKNHCVTCHADPCECFPANPTIKVGAWNSADNSVAVDISSARAVEIELYTSGGVKFAAIKGASGKHIFRYNAEQNNGSYYVRVKSAIGYNSGSFPFKVSALDIAAPNITGTTVQPANGVWAASKTLTAKATDQTNTLFSLRHEDGSPVPNCSDKEGIAGGSGFEVSWRIGEQIQENKTFRIIAKDRWGFSTESTITISKIDRIPPSKPTVSLDDNSGWHNKDVTVTISGGNAASGIDHYEYRVDGGVWRKGGTVLVADEGIHEVEAKAVSGSGLESDIVGAMVKIDLTKPTATYVLSPEDWTTENVTVTLYPADEGGSGLESVTLPSGETVYDLASIRIPVSQNGEYSFTVTDNAGNSSVVVVPVGNIAMLDVTVTLNVPFVISPDDDRLYSGGITFQNYSNVPVSLTLQRVTAYGNAPQLVGRDEKAWKSLSVADTKKYIALGLAGNGVDFWLDAQSKV